MSRVRIGLKAVSVAVICWVIAAGAMAAIDVYQFDSPQQEALFRKLTGELRCPKCQNQNIADSNAELAKDLRQKTYQLISEGKSEQEVIDYMVQRYGHFVIYKPPLTAATLILWLGPLLVIVIGMGAVAVRARGRRFTPPETLDAEEQQRLQRLLDEEK